MQASSTHAFSYPYNFPKGVSMSNERVLSSLLDTLFPCLVGDGDGVNLYSLRGSQFKGLPLKVLGLIDTKLNADDRSQIHLLLWLLSTRLGTLLLLGLDSLGPWYFPRAFPDLAITSRERGLLAWARSPHFILRKAFVGLKGLLLSTLVTWLDPDGGSPILESVGYSVSDPQRPAVPVPEAQHAEQVIRSRLIDLAHRVAQFPEGQEEEEGQALAIHIAAELASKGLRVTWPTHSSEISTSTASFRPSVWNARPAFVVTGVDAVVVGSGAGGGVTAFRLAASGLKVAILEKSSFVPAQDMSLKEGDSMDRMYEASGLLTTDSGGTTVLAGATLGGGTRVNWCASFKTPDHVRQEWSEKYGLTSFLSEEYDAALEEVCSRLTVRPIPPGQDSHGAMCISFANGLEAAGFHCGDVPRNCKDVHCGGHCCFGCARGQKQDAVNTFLADACGKGAWVMTGAHVSKVLTEERDRDTQQTEEKTGRQKRVVGVLVAVECFNTLQKGKGNQARNATLKFVIAAPTVVCCAGALHTPALLLRSGITCRGNVGSNLRLHPCAIVFGIFPPDKPIKCWEGPVMSKFSMEGGDWGETGYGALLFTPAAHPGLFAAAAPWHGGRAFKDLFLKFPNAVAVLILVRDRGAGRVTLEANSGNPRLKYTMGCEDKAAMVKGMMLGLTAVAAAGACEVMTLHTGYAVPGEDGLRHKILHGTGAAFEFQLFLKQVEEVGVPELGIPTFSAHQMGTARLGTSPESSVLDADGECWDVAGLYAADASTFPSPTGVNPMITVLAVAWMLAGRLAYKLKGGTVSSSC